MTIYCLNETGLAPCYKPRLPPVSIDKLTGPLQTKGTLNLFCNNAAAYNRALYKVKYICAEGTLALIPL